MLKRMKEKLHKILFPFYDREFKLLIVKSDGQVDKLLELRSIIEELKKQPIPTIADLMRQTLSLETVDFTNVEQDGLPKHFLDVHPDKRSLYISQLNQIYCLDVWHEMVKNHIDTQGNMSFRNLSGEMMEVWAGRFSVNGIYLLKNEVEKAHEEYIEKHSKEDSEESDGTTEGIEIDTVDIINNVIEKANDNQNT